MGDENVVDLVFLHLVASQLHLCAFATINQKKLIVCCNHLGGWMPVECRYRRIIAQYGDSEHAVKGLSTGLEATSGASFSHVGLYFGMNSLA